MMINNPLKVVRYPYAIEWQTIQQFDKQLYYDGWTGMAFLLYKHVELDDSWDICEARVCTNIPDHAPTDQLLRALEILLDIFIPQKQHFNDNCELLANYLAKYFRLENMEEMAERFGCTKTAAGIPVLLRRNENLAVQFVFRNRFTCNNKPVLDFDLKTKPVGSNEWDFRLTRETRVHVATDHSIKLAALEAILGAFALAYDPVADNSLSHVADTLTDITEDNFKAYCDFERIKRIAGVQVPPESADHLQKYFPIRGKAYRKFQMQWMVDHGVTMADIFELSEAWQTEGDFENMTFEEFIEEYGFGAGSLWPCYDEFLDAEYQMKNFMRTLLSPSEYLDYLEDIGSLRVFRISEVEEMRRTGTFHPVKFWSNGAGELHHFGEYDITEDDLPNELRKYYDAGLCDGAVYLVQHEEKNCIAIIAEYNLEDFEGTEAEKDASMATLFDFPFRDAVSLSVLPEFEDATMLITEKAGFDDCHELIAVFPHTISVEDFREALRTFDHVLFTPKDVSKVEGDRLTVTLPNGDRLVAEPSVHSAKEPGIVMRYLRKGKQDGPMLVARYGTNKLGMSCLPFPEEDVYVQYHRRSTAPASAFIDLMEDAKQQEDK